jgi:hypothetical protein
MGLTLEKIESRAKEIMKDRRIKGKAVILCEGTASLDEKESRCSPHTYGKLEQLPDAAFYKACLPKNMRSYKAPCFCNCGSRAEVLKVFVKLIELSEENIDSYLEIKNLFALVDLDLQKATIDNYYFSNTEEIFEALYEQLQIKHNNLINHIIFTTGFMYKEAYFLLPELQGLFNDYKNPIFFMGKQLSLEDLYSCIIKELESDKNLESHFDLAKKRLSFSNIDTSNISNLKASFLNKINQGNNDHIVKLLFLITKIKPYWKKLYTSDNLSEEKFREQLSLEIAKFYSEKNDPNFHLTAIFNSIYERTS